MENHDRHPQDDDFDFIAYIKVLYRYRLMIFVFLVVGFCIAALVTLRQPKVFEASATFFPVNFNTVQNVTSDIVVTDSKHTISKMLIAVLECRTMADRIIEQLDLQQVWGKDRRVDAREILHNISEVTVEPQGLIRLSVVSSEPILAAEIANSYVDNLAYFNEKFELGAQRKVIQVVDRAIVPEEPRPNNALKKIVLGGLIGFILSSFAAFFINYIRKNNIAGRILK